MDIRNTTVYCKTASNAWKRAASSLWSKHRLFCIAKLPIPIATKSLHLNVSISQSYLIANP